MSEKNKPADKIRDIPSYSKLAKDATGIDALGKIWPIMKLLGLVKGEFPVDKEGIADLKRRAEELLNLPDKFNEAFASRGWIAYEALGMDLMSRAVSLVQAGKVGEAEAEILAYYKSEDKVLWHLQTMMAVMAWRPREDLASLAMTDYLAGRYHASTPVVLALMDGLVSDLATTGFFAEGTEIVAWDSVAGHSSGLKAICDIFNKGRRKTTSEEILMPYRHGILHGRDLGYSNVVVAAKTWGALFAVREWALKVEEGTSKPPDEPERNEDLGEVLRSIQGSIENLEEIRRDREEIDKWKPREHDSESEPREEAEEGSPERAAFEILKLWRMRNYGGIAGYLSALSGDESIAKRAGRIRQNIEPKQIDSFEMLAVADETVSISVVTVRVKGKASFAIETEYYSFGLRMIYENPEGDILLRGKPGGSWRVIEASLYAPRKEELLSNSGAIKLRIEDP